MDESPPGADRRNLSTKQTAKVAGLVRSKVVISAALRLVRSL
jgi:hypothetical protein